MAKFQAMDYIKVHESGVVVTVFLDKKKCWMNIVSGYLSERRTDKN